jgi:hypothetical protein
MPESYSFSVILEPQQGGGFKARPRHAATRLREVLQ